MQRMWDLGKWECVEAGEVRSFTRDVARTVRIEVNAPDITRLYIQYKGEAAAAPRFLARVCGRDVLEFSVDGPFDFTTDAELWFYTIDGQDVSVSKTDHESMARMMERRVRNPELEHMMYLAQRNMEIRLEQQAQQFERTLNTRLAAERHVRSAAERREPGRTDDPGTSAATGGGNSPAEGADDQSGQPDAKAKDTAGAGKPDKPGSAKK